MGLREQVKQLESEVNHLPKGKQDFAKSLIHQWNRKGRLSQPQQLWVDKLIELAAEAKKPKPVPESTDLGIDLTGLHRLFDRAKQNNIPVPKIRTALADGKKVVLSPARVDSANAGFIYIRFGEQYYGKVSPDGKLTLPSFVEPCEEVHELIQEIANDPSKAGKAQGQRLGWCIFCSRTLTTNESLFYGYGPICAEKWGLEWGNATERKAEKKEAELDARIERAGRSIIEKSGLPFPILDLDSGGDVEPDDFEARLRK
jgi:hypothetical protein